MLSDVLEVTPSQLVRPDLQIALRVIKQIPYLLVVQLHDRYFDQELDLLRSGVNALEHMPNLGYSSSTVLGIIPASSQSIDNPSMVNVFPEEVCP